MRPHVWLTILLMSLLFAAAWLQYASRPVDTRRPAAPIHAGQLIDLNRADVATLMLLPGIGPSLAERIVSHRQENGPFGKVEDLAAVRGIGPVMIQRLSGLVTCTTDPPEPGPRP